MAINGTQKINGKASQPSGGLDETSLQLLQLSGLIQTWTANYIAAKNDTSADDQSPLPSRELFDAQRTLLAAAGMLTELVSDPSSRIIEVALQQFEARSLHLAAATRVPDILAEKGEMSVDELSSQVGIEKKKLSRVMRCLCSIHLFSEPREDVFANNRITSALVGNDPLRAYVLLGGQDVYTASDYLPRTLRDPVKGPSYSVEVTPFQDAVGTSAPRWTWLEEQPRIRDLLDGRNGPDGKPSAYPGNFGTEMQTLAERVAARQSDREEKVARPEHGLFGLAMVGGGRVFGLAHLYDFPWASLGEATVVDVGGGMGGFCLQLSHIYPSLRFVVQDRGPVLKQGETELWPRENLGALQAGRVRFVQHDFFDENPIKGADVYWLRYIIHDWSDDYCVRILQAIKAAMGPRSRILICDQVMNTTGGCAELASAPAPLPANYGYFTRYSHTRDLTVMSLINGIERKPTEFRDLVERSGLHLNRFWECRSQVGLVEVVLPDSELRLS
ncbi:S-adenosyl-L-methionine-dependent methyltransferase [Corynascus novoguineensis]|uniref:S-adenosyl-L-methionine-dependent methyltransferase n=1 Tax=Corynascus novoguineensis TaxID=1126955 RepID=A0AAN7CLU2_9PEZI|nr:S-adenosyl-L-methionine-dependent methyltransferase [Corynascus novoguineensis]